MLEPSLLVSIHDVSPLTWSEAASAVDLAQTCGVSVDALTLLVIPRHEGTAPLTSAPSFVGWLRELADRGATLVAHGLTHRMQRRVLLPHRALWAYLFAGGQGEFYAATQAETRRWFETIRADFADAELDEALAGFVPPAWLLSAAARAEIWNAGFTFIETMGGIRFQDRLLARRLIGWGARNPLEALITSTYARLQASRKPVDTRLAIHPADLRSGICHRSIHGCLDTLLDRMAPRSYREFLRRAGTPAPTATMIATAA